MQNTSPTLDRKDIENFLKEEIDSFYRMHFMLPLLREFWNENFAAGLIEKFRRQYKTELTLQLETLDMKGSATRCFIVKDAEHMKGEGIAAKEHWKVYFFDWKVSFGGMDITHQKRIRVSLQYDTTIQFALTWDANGVIEILEATPNAILVKSVELEVNHQRTGMMQLPRSITLATYNPSTREYVLDRKGLSGIAQRLIALLHAEVGGINQWLWEIAELIVRKLSEELRGMEIECILDTETGIIRKRKEIAAVEILPPQAQGNYGVSGKPVALGREKVSTAHLQHPIQILTKDGENIRGSITVGVSFVEPPQKEYLTPHIELNGVILHIEQKVLHAHIIDFHKVVMVKTKQLPPPQALIDDAVWQKIITEVQGKIRRPAPRFLP